ncbi:Ff.00g065260.m01.CDS01 [Fusarium sp. VM40]|nr:Ff.00g065260.m01.CDS01 [Fusarium sp. VM40]
MHPFPSNIQGKTEIKVIKGCVEVAAPLGQVPPPVREKTREILRLSTLDWNKELATKVLGPNYFIHTSRTAPNLSRVDITSGSDPFYKQWVKTTARNNIGRRLNEGLKALVVELGPIEEG